LFFNITTSSIKLQEDSFTLHNSYYKQGGEERFKDGRLRAIVTLKVLDEGIYVSDASLGVIVSGTGSSREFIQRLGRLLRKREKGEVYRVDFEENFREEAKPGGGKH